MSWLEKLNETYEHCSSAIGVIEKRMIKKNGKQSEIELTPLLPVSHTMQNAHIEITINEDGKFLSAKIVDKSNAPTLIPCTESSSGRTSGQCPHPLHDKLEYVAKDYEKITRSQCIFNDDIIDFSKLKARLSETKWISNLWISETDMQKQDVSTIVQFINNSIILGQINLYELNCSEIKGAKLKKFQKDHGEKCSYFQHYENEKLQFINRYIFDIIFSKYIKKVPQSDHLTYFKQISDWHLFAPEIKELNAVFNYIKSNTIVDDCVSHKVLYLDINKRLLNTYSATVDVPQVFKLLPGGVDKKGNEKLCQADAFVRFCVETKESLSSSLQSNPALWQSWSDFCKNQEVRIDVCYSTGVETSVAKQHPSKIRNSGDKAKLISVNDNSGFTFRGKFTSGEQACSIAFEVTQKAHNALRWLISRQGRKFGDQTIVTWATLGDLPPDPWKSSYDLFISPSDVSDEDAEIPEVVESKKYKIGKEKKPLVVYTAQDFAEKINAMLSGYSKKFTNDDTNLIMIMAIDSATTGRMAVRYYRELRGSDFLERVREWHESCSWHQYFGFYKQFVGAPAPKDIAEAAYGKKLDSKNKLLNATVSRLIPCIIDAAPIPSDLVDSCIRRACQRISMEYWEWNKTLGIACALYSKQYQNENYTMEYEEKRNTRDYLYGSLLAIADHIEERALHMASEKRDTNAAKLMQRFAERPFSTWRTLYLQLTPYLSRLKNKNSALHLRLNKQLDDLYSRIQSADFIQDDPLSGEFLLGFHTLRKKLWEKTTDQIESDNSQNEQES